MNGGLEQNPNQVVLQSLLEFFGTHKGDVVSYTVEPQILAYPPGGKRSSKHIRDRSQIDKQEQQRPGEKKKKNPPLFYRHSPILTSSKRHRMSGRVLNARSPNILHTS
jgi:hypothetical protein